MILHFSPANLPRPFGEEFFCGAWHPTDPLQPSTSAPQPLAVVRGRNWFLLGTVNPDSGTSPVHHAAVTRDGLNFGPVAFRGYVVDPPVHTWSDPNLILANWKNRKAPFNGSFGLARILDDGSTLELTADVLGIGPLYYRQVGKLVLFATNPRLLTLGQDQLDLTAGRILLQSHFVWGNNGLISGVKKVPPGSQLRFTENGDTRSLWFDFGALPLGDEPITKQSLRELEDSFQTGIDRLLELRFGNVALPLSGGNDSRRILAAIVSRHEDFVAHTVRIFHDGRDMDASFATQIAKRFAFPHNIIELPRGSDFASLDRLRRTLVDGEGIEHTWWAAMGITFKPPTMLFDGLCGASSYGAYNAEKAVGDPAAFGSSFSPSYWPSAKHIQEYLNEFLRDIPPGNNRDSLAHSFLRTRSGPALMATRLLPIGNLAVFPFFDLDYLKYSLRFLPVQKATQETALQQRCLSEFWPQYASLPTTRNPPKMDAPFRAIQIEQWTACLRQLNSESGYPLYGDLKRALTPRARALALAAPYSTKLSTRIRWWLEPFLTLAARQARQRPAWKLS